MSVTIIGTDHAAGRHDVSRLERAIERGTRDGGPFSTAYATRKDRTEAFPAEAMTLLDDFGLHRWFVPRQYGGLLELPTLVQLLRVVARRDLTVAIAYGKTFLGSAPVWVAGDHDQAAWLAERLAKPSLVTWALTERGHGSDLLSGEVTAAAVGDGWRLDGEKWLINNAARAPLVCLLARSRPAVGPRSFSLFLIAKDTLATGSFRCLPAERLHGIRGADISGIAFAGAVAPPQALIGEEGAGLEIVLRTMQLTRTACVSLSLGAADEALRLALGFAHSRRIYNHAMTDLPVVRSELGALFADLMTAEVVGHVASRYAHVLPGEMSVVAAVAKAIVPMLGDEIIERAARLLGARGVLSEEYANGIFPKLQRDHRIVAIFDGSITVNRAALVNQFPGLARAFRAAIDHATDPASWALDGIHGSVLGDLAALDDQAPAPLAFDELQLLSRTGCTLLQGMPRSLQQLEVAGGVRGAAAAELALLGAHLRRELDGVMTQAGGFTGHGRNIPAAGFRLAARLELCFAAAAAVRVWLHNCSSRSDDPLWEGGLWLRTVLARVLMRLNPSNGLGLAVLDRTSVQLTEYLLSREQDDVSPGLTSTPAPGRFGTDDERDLTINGPRRRD